MTKVEKGYPNESEEVERDVGRQLIEELAVIGL